MNNEYVDLVLARFKDGSKIFLSRAPGFSLLSTGDEVDIGTAHSAIVLVRETFKVDDPTIKKLIKAIGATEPLKRIHARIERKVFEYPGEEEEF